MASQTLQFNKGDVEIHFSKTDEKFVLHSYVLELHSEWFQKRLSSQWNNGKDQTSVHGENHSVFELRFDENEAFGDLRRRLISSGSETSNGIFLEGSSAKLPLGTNAAAAEIHEKRVKRLKAHQNMCRTLYHFAPSFNHSCFDTAISSITELAAVAEYYGSVKVIKTHIDNHLLLFRSEVEERCARTPLDMLQLALTVKSEWIFMEASTKLLGRNDTEYKSALPKLEALGIAELMEAKRSDFVQMIQECELKMFKLRVGPTQRPWEGQVALWYFKQWLTERLNEGQGSSLVGRYAILYRGISPFSGGFHPTAHLATVTHFVNGMFAATQEQIDGIMIALRDVLQRAAQTIQPLMDDKSKGEDNKMDVFRDLTCMGIGDDELPWVKK